MDRISDSGSDDMGSSPFGVTNEVKEKKDDDMGSLSADRQGFPFGVTNIFDCL